MKDNKKIIRRLLNLSQLVLDEIDVLANLSYRDKENTSQFDDHVKDISDYLNQERIILNNISLDNLEIIFKELKQYDDDSDAYLRCYVLVDDKIEELYNDKEEDNDYERYNELEDNIENDDTQKENEDDATIFLEKYHVDEEENEKYAIKVLDNVATIVIKRMLSRIENTITDNKKDNKYKKVLIKYFKKFKYFYFTLDNELELLGAKYKFNLNNIPMPYSYNIDISKIYHNQCVTILDKLYSSKEIDYNPDNMEEALFNMMLLEEYLKGIDEESINKLIELTDELEVKYGHNFYGNIAKNKVLTRKN